MVRQRNNWREKRGGGGRKRAEGSHEGEEATRHSKTACVSARIVLVWTLVIVIANYLD